MIAFPLKLKEKTQKTMCALASRDFSLTFRFRISFFNTNTKCSRISGISGAFSSEEREEHPAFRDVKNVGYWNSFLLLDVAHVLRCVCAGAEGMPRKDSGTQTDKITHRHLQRVSLLTPPPQPALPPPPPPSPPPTPPCKNPLGCSSHLPRRIFSLP